jgi:hypothetical protein
MVYDETLLVGPSLISFIGAAIALGSSSICRLIIAQILIGFGFATVPLAYCVPSEILPRKWRPSESTCLLLRIHNILSYTFQTWVPNALSLVQAVVAPVLSSASDTFQVQSSLASFFNV